MRVWIDERACVGNGVCEELSPEVFVMTGDIAKVRDANVRPGLENAVLAAAEECPVGCIHVGASVDRACATR